MDWVFFQSSTARYPGRGLILGVWSRIRHFLTKTGDMAGRWRKS
jgi:hypothetical protein